VGPCVIGQQRETLAETVKLRQRQGIPCVEIGECSGIVVPVEATQRELDNDPQRAPMYLFFETDGMVYQRETKERYPFRYVKPRQPDKR
jgi:hypothetical protein